MFHGIILFQSNRETQTLKFELSALEYVGCRIAVSHESNFYISIYVTKNTMDWA